MNTRSHPAEYLVGDAPAGLKKVPGIVTVPDPSRGGQGRRVALNVDPRPSPDRAHLTGGFSGSGDVHLSPSGGSGNPGGGAAAGGSAAPLAIWPHIDGRVAGGRGYRGEQDGLTYGSRPGHSHASRSRPGTLADVVGASRDRVGRDPRPALVIGVALVIGYWTDGAPRVFRVDGSRRTGADACRSCVGVVAAASAANRSAGRLDSSKSAYRRSTIGWFRRFTSGSPQRRRRDWPNRMIADAARRARDVEAASIVPSRAASGCGH